MRKKLGQIFRKYLIYLPNIQAQRFFVNAGKHSIYFPQNTSSYLPYPVWAQTASDPCSDRPMDYDDELQRVIDFATVAKEAIPNVQVAAPSTCAWWFCM
jgi:hypothetical protein